MCLLCFMPIIHVGSTSKGISWSEDIMSDCLNFLALTKLGVNCRDTNQKMLEILALNLDTRF